ncbi:MAG: oligosaccharide flippase family protein [Eubacterium sp.]|nr:oligosaccharide flippase family protein [Eubacterium sp.]
MNRTKNASKNIFFGAILKLYQIIIPFILRTAMIKYLGMEYIGLNSLFISILSVLNLAELGVGSAMVFSMYKPIAEDDEVTICALMRLYKIYYRIIGLVILSIGVVLTPAIPKLITGTVPSGINVYILYWLNLGATVVSYWLFGYKTCLLTAHQRTYVSSRTLLCTNSVQYILQFLALALFRNYYYYLFIALFLQAVSNIVSAIIVDKMFPNYHPKGKLDKEVVKQINQRVRDLFTNKLGSVLLNSADSIVISAFLGLSSLAVYNNYYYVINCVMGFITIFYNSITAGIGNSILTETKEKNYTDFKTFQFIVFWIVAFCGSCLLCLYQPFMKLWIGDTKYVLPFTMVILFCVYFLSLQMIRALETYKDAGGIWHEDRFRPLIAAIVNLVINLILVRYIGLYGIIVSTILASLFVNVPWLIHNVFVNIFRRGCWEQVLKMLRYILIDVFIAAVTYILCNFVHGEGYLAFVLKILICVISSNAMIITIYFKTSEFKEAIQIMWRMVPDKLRKGREK